MGVLFPTDYPIPKDDGVVHSLRVRIFCFEIHKELLSIPVEQGAKVSIDIEFNKPKLLLFERITLGLGIVNFE